jgi:DNA invertase Pin-like site-specific DNA recombinase
MSKRVAIYARYSSREQDGSTTIESQTLECKQYALSQGWQVLEDHIYVDEAKSGTTIEGRDAFREMIAAAQQKPRPFDVILVWHTSRFARDRVEASRHKQILKGYGVELKSASQELNEDTPEGQLLSGFYEILDEYYSARLDVEVRRGLKENARQGFRTGGTPPYGYKKVYVDDPDGRKDKNGNVKRRPALEVEPEQAEVVRRIYMEYIPARATRR